MLIICNKSEYAPNFLGQHKSSESQVIFTDGLDYDPLTEGFFDS